MVVSEIAFYRILGAHELTPASRELLADARLHVHLASLRYARRFAVTPWPSATAMVRLIAETTADRAEVTTPPVVGLYTPRRGILLNCSLRGARVKHVAFHEAFHWRTSGSFRDTDEEEEAAQAFAREYCGGCSLDGPQDQGGPPLRWLTTPSKERFAS